jgi:hypothetical protein
MSKLKVRRVIGMKYEGLQTAFRVAGRWECEDQLLSAAQWLELLL